jgi:hypothetical protein
MDGSIKISIMVSVGAGKKMNLHIMNTLIVLNA